MIYRRRSDLDPQFMPEGLADFIGRRARLQFDGKQHAVGLATEIGRCHGLDAEIVVRPTPQSQQWKALARGPLSLGKPGSVAYIPVPSFALVARQRRLFWTIRRRSKANPIYPGAARTAGRSCFWCAWEPKSGENCGWVVAVNRLVLWALAAARPDLSEHLARRSVEMADG